MGGGRVEAIYISAEHGELPHAVESVRAIAGKGLEGNRYFDEGRPESELTLIEAEALERLAAEHGIDAGRGRLATERPHPGSRPQRPRRQALPRR